MIYQNSKFLIVGDDMFCPKCGSNMPDGVKFCQNCGTPLAQQTQVPPDTASQPQMYTAAPQQSSDVQKEPNQLLIFFLTVLICGSILAAVMLFVKPGYLISKDDSSSVTASSRKDKKSDEAPDKKEDSSSEEKTETQTEKPAETSAPEGTVTEVQTETKPSETSAPVETSGPEGPSGVPDVEITKYHTEEKPEMEAFDWFYGQNGVVESVPEGAEEITDIAYIIGGWKCLMDYNPSDESSNMKELDNADISLSNSKVKMTLKGYKLVMPGDSGTFSVDGDDPEEVLGDWDNGKVSLDTGSMVIKIEHFYMMKDADGTERQYGVGKLYAGDLDFGYIALVRP